MRGLSILLSLLVLSGAPAVAPAADRDVTVRFEPGASSGHYENPIRGYDVVRYHLDARARQELSIDFYGDENSCNFVVQGPDEQTIFDEVYESRKFRHQLEETGTYTIVAGMMRNSARRGRSCNFSLDISITD
jgi:hypothetical protein